MTISTQNRTAGPFAGNGVTAAFPFTFKVFQASDLKVVRRVTATDTETTLVLNSNYTVTLNPNQNANPGGVVTLSSALATGQTLTVTTELPYLQATDLTNQGGFYPQVITNALDRLTIFAQQLFAGLGRSLKYPLSDSGIDPTLPGKDALRGRVLAFHETTGRPIAGPSTTSVGTVGGAIGAIQTVADNIADVNTVAGDINDVNAVGQNIGDVNDVADSLAAVGIVANNIADVNLVAANIDDVTHLADVYLGPRPSDPSTRTDGSPLQAGDLYFNTETDRLRVYTGSRWSEANTGAVSVQQFTGDGVTVDFQLNSAPDSENVVQVFVDGVYQSKTVYDITGPNADILTFTSPPPNGAAIEAVTFSVLPLGVVDASQVQMPGGGTLDQIAAPDNTVPVGGVAAGDLGRKYSEYISVTDFGAKPDNIAVDDSAAFLSVIQNGFSGFIPEGKSYYIANPIDVTGISNITLHGPHFNARSSSGMDKVRIYAPNGLFKNTGIDRVFLDLRNFFVVGNDPVVGVYSGICIDGRFGGSLYGVAIEKYSRCMANDFAYLLWFDFCRFDRAHKALSLATANGSGTRSCWFGANLEESIDFLDEDLVIGGQSATRVAATFEISGTNFNLGPATKRIARLRGTVTFHSNYIEAFLAPSSPEEYLIDYVAGRFDGSALSVKYNEINGQGHCSKLLSLRSDHALGTTFGRFSGELEDNRIYGFTSEKFISVGNPAGGVGPVLGFRIGRNSASSGLLTEYVEYNADLRNISNSCFLMGSSISTAIAGATYTRLPLELITPAQADYTSAVDANAWVRRQQGLWKIDVSLIFSSSTDLRNIECRLRSTATTLQAVTQSLNITAEAGIHYQTVSINWVGELGPTDQVYLEGRNGGSVHRWFMTAQQIK